MLHKIQCKLLYLLTFSLYIYYNDIRVINVEVTSDRGYVYSIQYHMVWFVKYRHKIITSNIEKSLIER